MDKQKEEELEQEHTPKLEDMPIPEPVEMLSMLAPGIRKAMTGKGADLDGLEGMDLDGEDASMTVQRQFNPVAGEVTGEQLQLMANDPNMNLKTTQKLGEGELTDNEGDQSYNINLTHNNSGI